MVHIQEGRVGYAISMSVSVRHELEIGDSCLKELGDFYRRSVQHHLCTSQAIAFNDSQTRATPDTLGRSKEISFRA